MRMLTVAFLVIMTCTVMADGVLLVKESSPRATVVVPDDATETISFAADEFVRYIEKISGAKLPIASGGGDIQGTPVYIGPTAAAQGLRPEGPEGFAISVGDNRVVICGGGTLFGVYRFLEKVLGCRWLGWKMDFVPQAQTITVEPMEMVTSPVFDMRTFKGDYRFRRQWGVKMGMNGFYGRDVVAETDNGYYFPKDVPGCHAYHRIIPADMYFDEHPEWFALRNGKRQPGDKHGSQLCVTAEGLADEFAKRVIGFFDADPNFRVMSISPNDGRGWCQCEDCQALDERLCNSRTTKQGLAGESPFRGDRVFWFANQVARRVGKVYPDKKLLILAYINYAEPPDTIVPEDNVIPWLCHYAPADYSSPINDPTSEPNSQFNALLKDWADVAPHLLFYSYVSKSMWWRLPRPIMHNFAKDIKYLHSLGFHRYYCQSGLSDPALDGPLYYVIAKLLWHPSADPDKIAADWRAHTFGEAADEMAEYYAAVEGSIRDGHAFSDNPPRHVPGLYRFEQLDRAMDALDAAKEAADSDEASERIERITTVFKYGYNMIECLEAAARFKDSPTRELMQKALTNGEKALEYYRNRKAANFVKTLRMNDQLGVIARGLGDTEDVGGRHCWNTDETGPGDNRAGWVSFWTGIDDPEKPLRMEMDMWGKSDFNGIVVNTGGEGKSYDEGGIWKRVKPNTPLSGSEQWDTLVFDIPAKLLAPGKKTQRFGMGGADSQIWVSEIRIETAER